MVDPFAPFDEHGRPIVHAFDHGEAAGQLVVNLAHPDGSDSLVLDGQDATDFEADLAVFVRAWAETRWPTLHQLVWG